MRKVALTIVLLSLCANISAFQSANQWDRFTTPDGSCSLIMPITPSEQVEKKDTTSGQIVSKIYIAKTGSNIYLLGITDYPVDIDSKQELELDRDNFLKAVKANLVDDSDITLSGNPGKEFSGVSDTYTYKSRVFVVGRRAYQVVAGQPTGSFDSQQVNTFLRSFQFVKKA